MPTIASARCRSSQAVDLTPTKRTLCSNSGTKGSPLSSFPAELKVSPISRKSPCQSINDSPSSPAKRNVEKSSNRVMKPKSPLKKRLLDSFIEKPNLNRGDVGKLSEVKEALHVSTSQLNVVCRENEQNKVLEFCKRCVENEKAGSLYICGCPGTGKSVFMEKVKETLVHWAKQVEGYIHLWFELPDVLSINCTSLTTTSEIFSKIAERSGSLKKVHGASPLQHLQSIYSQSQQSGMKMMLIIADELDFLITRDWAVLHDLFMLTTLPLSGCILLGIANSIDLADRFLPKLQSMNCKCNKINVEHRRIAENFG
ncbi:replication origin binding protein [Lithospermum erythrorhizon]|uniref:Replication origin binding protein n=1 Tax=Lithospermum erythrorhizon TaxID=34254 RepID=A0AAV3QG15_LITER